MVFFYYSFETDTERYAAEFPISMTKPARQFKLIKFDPHMAPRTITIFLNPEEYTILGGSYVDYNCLQLLEHAIAPKPIISFTPNKWGGNYEFFRTADANAEELKEQMVEAHIDDADVAQALATSAAYIEAEHNPELMEQILDSILRSPNFLSY